MRGRSIQQELRAGEVRQASLEEPEPTGQLQDLPRDFRDIQNPDPEGEPLTEKQQIVMKLRVQNESLKAELKGLSSKLEDFMQKQTQKKITQMHEQLYGGPNLDHNPMAVPTRMRQLSTMAQFANDPTVRAKEKELKESQAKINFYKKEVDTMRRQLEESYNIQKITQLEDEQKNKKRILQQLQEENRSLVKVQKDQEKALQSLSKENDYEKKIHELNVELKQAKDHLRKLQYQQREDERSMKMQHETLVALEEKCRKMALVIKDKKKKRQEFREQQQNADQTSKVYTREDLQQLENDLRAAEQEKVIEEKKLKEQVKGQEESIKALQAELAEVTQQVKEKDQEYRLNELKIKELRRQIPAKILKPIDQRTQALNKQNAKNRQTSPQQSKMVRNGSAQQLPVPRAHHLRTNTGANAKMHSNSLNQLPKATTGGMIASVPPRPSQISRPTVSESEPLSGGLPQSLKKRRNSNTRIVINADNSVPQSSSQAVPAQVPASESKPYALPVDDAASNELRAPVADQQDQLPPPMQDGAQPIGALEDVASLAPSQIMRPEPQNVNAVSPATLPVAPNTTQAADQVLGGQQPVQPSPASNVADELARI